VVEPPGYAIHRGEDGGVFAEQWSYPARNVSHASVFDCDNNVILLSKFFGRFGNTKTHFFPLALADKDESVALNALQRCSSYYCTNVNTG
jgi:hypothetical protein